VSVDPHLVQESSPHASSGPAAIPFVGCDPQIVGTGWHELETTAQFPVRRVWLSSGRVENASTTAAVLTHVSRRNDGFTIQGRTTGAAVVLAGETYSTDWNAQINGRSAGRPLSLDTQTAWQLTDGGRFQIRGSLGPEWEYRIALIITALGLILCFVLLARGRVR
jgi:hypothetical protein